MHTPNKVSGNILIAILRRFTSGSDLILVMGGGKIKQTRTSHSCGHDGESEAGRVAYLICKKGSCPGSVLIAEIQPLFLVVSSFYMTACTPARLPYKKVEMALRSRKSRRKTKQIIPKISNSLVRTTDTHFREPHPWLGVCNGAQMVHKRLFFTSGYTGLIMDAGLVS